MKKRRKKWRAPNNPNPIARRLYRAIYGEPWPKGWRVEWRGFMRGCLGLTVFHSSRILLSYGDAKGGTKSKASIHKGEPEGVIGTLVHEFVHMRNPEMNHGKEFSRLVIWAWEKLQQVKL